MSRPLALRLTVLAAVAGVTAAATAPALAATDETKVSYIVADGTRQFSVMEVDGVTPLADFTFDAGRQKPFRTLVEDVNRPLLSDGYQVNASMTNLYLKTDTGYDYTEKIPAKNLSLTYGDTPLVGTSTLPVLPRVSLTGLIGDCSNPQVQSALGISLDPITGLLNLTLLSPLLQTVCTELAGLDATARTVDVTVDGVAEMVTAALALPDLPFSLTGGEGGRFTEPSFQGAIATNDPAKGGTPTSKRVMTGNPLALTGDMSLMLDALTAALTAQLPSTLVGATGGVTTVTGAVAAISAENGPLATTISRLGAGDQLDMINLLTKSLLDVDLTALTTVTGEYNAYPVLQAGSYSAKQGTYDGTLIVDFFETGS